MSVHIRTSFAFRLDIDGSSDSAGGRCPLYSLRPGDSGMSSRINESSDRMTHGVIIQPGGKVRLGDFLNQSFADGNWNEFRAAIAFVKYSGTKHIRLVWCCHRRTASALTAG